MLQRRMVSCFVARRDEIEADAHARICAVSDPGEIGDLAYLRGLRVALSSAFDYALAGLEEDAASADSVPPAVLSQAHLAARCGVSLDTVLRRYFAGYSLFVEFLVREAEASTSSGADLHRLISAQAARFDHLVAAVGEAYHRQSLQHPRSDEAGRVRRVEALLGGDLMVGEELDYDLDCMHIGLIACGPGAAETARNLAVEFDLRLLLVRPDDEVIWAWFGTSRRIDADRFRRSGSVAGQDDLRLALGEQLPGISGWRLTHNQAKAALAVGANGGERVVGYGKVALLASVLGDELVAASLRELFLKPLAHGGRGATLLDTVRAYLAAGRNVSSAAAALGVSRQTVTSRLGVAEARLGRNLAGCVPELEMALRLDEFERRLAQGAVDGLDRSSSSRG